MRMFKKPVQAPAPEPPELVFVPETMLDTIPELTECSSSPILTVIEPDLTLELHVE